MNIRDLKPPPGLKPLTVGSLRYSIFVCDDELDDGWGYYDGEEDRMKAHVIAGKALAIHNHAYVLDTWTGEVVWWSWKEEQEG